MNEERNTVYLMEKICMNEGFPDICNEGFVTVIPYHYVKFVRAYGDLRGPEREFDDFPDRELRDLKMLQDAGTRIVSGVSGHSHIIRVGKDLQIYRGIHFNNQARKRLKQAGIEPEVLKD